MSNGILMKISFQAPQIIPKAVVEEAGVVFAKKAKIIPKKPKQMSRVFAKILKKAKRLKQMSLKSN